MEYHEEDIETLDSSAGLFESSTTIMTSLGSSTSIVNVMRFVASELPALVDVDQARLFLIKHHAGGGGGKSKSVLWTLSNGAAFGHDDDGDDKVEAPINTGPVGEAATTGVLFTSGR